MQELNVLEVPFHNDFFKNDQTARILSATNPFKKQYDEEPPNESNLKYFKLIDPKMETDIYDSAIDEFSLRGEINDFIKVQDPFKTESDLNLANRPKETSKVATCSQSPECAEEPTEYANKPTETARKPFFDEELSSQKREEETVGTSSYVVSSENYSYSYTCSVEVENHSPNQEEKNEEESQNDSLSKSMNPTKRNITLSDEEMEKFKKSHRLSFSHDIKKMNVNNYNDHKEHVSWEFPQTIVNQIEKREEMNMQNMHRSADIYKVDLNEDDEEQFNYQPPKLSACFIVDASYQMIEVSDYSDDDDNIDTNENDSKNNNNDNIQAGIQTAPESEIPISDPKPILDSGEPASSFNSAQPVSLIINEPTAPRKRKSPRARNAAKFSDIKELERLDMLSESACILSESERGCYNIDDV